MPERLAEERASSGEEGTSERGLGAQEEGHGRDGGGRKEKREVENLSVDPVHGARLGRGPNGGGSGEILSGSLATSTCRPN